MIKALMVEYLNALLGLRDPLTAERLAHVRKSQLREILCRLCELCDDCGDHKFQRGAGDDR